MTYRLDDEGAFDRRTVEAGNEAAGAVARAGQWCAHELTDGMFSRALAMTIAPARVWERAVSAGLVEKLDKGAYRIVDYLKWNWSREKVLAERAATLSRVKRLRNGRCNAVTDGVRTEDETSSVAGNVQGTALGIGSGSDPEGSAEGRGDRPSEVRLKSVPPPPSEPAEQARIRDAILAEPKLSDLDAVDLASEALTTMMAKGFKLAWMLQAVRDAASKSERGEQRHVRHGRLIGFFRRAKPKRDDTEPKAPPSQREDDDPAVLERIRRMPRRVGPELDLPPDMKALVGKIGAGGT